MTSTVLITLAGPMQSWAGQPRGSQIRPTQDHPTKRGVIGLIANACGRDWADDISDLTALRFGVRADRAGVVDTDYQTAGGSGRYPLLPGEVMANPKWRKAAAKAEPNSDDFPFDYLPAKDIVPDKDGHATAGTGNASLTTVEYIADAVFTVALTGADHTVKAVAAALDNPARILFLGRKAYSPSEPLLAGTTGHDDPQKALEDWPLHERADTTGPRAWIEVSPLTPGSVVVADQPTDFQSRTSEGRAELTITLTPDHQEPAAQPHLVDEIDFFTDANP